MTQLSPVAVEILENKMCIIIEHLFEKIESEQISCYSDKVCEAIEHYCDCINNDIAIEQFGSYFESITKDLDEEKEPYPTLDVLRMAFYRFSSGGLHNLYVHQENESWYPKIILRSVLKPNDIESLPEIITIYRGGSKSEIQSGDYGQSWTKNIDVAKQFAFDHYRYQDWFSSDARVVLKATCSRENVLYSNQKCDEYEVAVKLGMVENVRIEIDGNSLLSRKE